MGVGGGAWGGNLCGSCKTIKHGSKFLILLIIAGFPIGRPFCVCAGATNNLWRSWRPVRARGESCYGNNFLAKIAHNSPNTLPLQYLTATSVRPLRLSFFSFIVLRDRIVLFRFCPIGNLALRYNCSVIVCILHEGAYFIQLKQK